MFDQVSPRYDLLNALMTLGRDGSWRRAMWAEVPEHATQVLDLCTGSGVSLPGLRRPGRLVIGADVSLRMLEVAAAETESAGWAPRLVAADAFRLPFSEATLDAVTVAFGMRNLRPRDAALRELSRVLKPGGVLVVLEAAAPRPGPFAPFHRFHLRHVVPLLGRLSPDPAAYAYLARSIEEFGSGETFERDLGAAGFTVPRTRSFLLGATRLWVAAAPGVQPARSSVAPRSELPHPAAAGGAEWRWWIGVQLLLSTLLTVALVVAFVMFLNPRTSLALPGSWRLPAR